MEALLLFGRSKRRSSRKTPWCFWRLAELLKNTTWRQRYCRMSGTAWKSYKSSKNNNNIPDYTSHKQNKAEKKRALLWFPTASTVYSGFVTYLKWKKEEPGQTARIAFFRKEESPPPHSYNKSQRLSIPQLSIWDDLSTKNCNPPGTYDNL